MPFTLIVCLLLIQTFCSHRRNCSIKTFLPQISKVLFRQPKKQTWSEQWRMFGWFDNLSFDKSGFGGWCWIEKKKKRRKNPLEACLAATMMVVMMSESETFSFQFFISFFCSILLKAMCLVGDGTSLEFFLLNQLIDRFTLYLLRASIASWPKHIGDRLMGNFFGLLSSQHTLSRKNWSILVGRYGDHRQARWSTFTHFPLIQSSSSSSSLISANIIMDGPHKKDYPIFLPQSISISIEKNLSLSFN